MTECLQGEDLVTNTPSGAGEALQEKQADRSKRGGTVERAQKGTLYVCPTPIGNLEDITLRVLRVLKEVSLIAAEDTRHTRRLLAHFGIQTPLKSYHSQNQRARGEELLARLTKGESVALVSDAGTPGISDPGAALIREALSRGVPVEVLPGPSAVLTALVASGLDTSRFVFEGFLPVRRRRRALQGLAAETRTIVIFEAPHRCLATLTDALMLLGDRPVAVARELTKVHEEVFRGLLSQAIEHFKEKPPKGEITVVIAGRQPEAKKEEAVKEAEVCSTVRELTATGMQRRAAIKEAARRFGLSSRIIYTIIEKEKAKGNTT
ncbi:MAG TPA: 16S rRNA (cytidine(1402)-2'-O)-methyltransferase [Desulfotomaculum sp.]|nr:16S rRNA (cytidine(1402)-2'-O)-methyltransferase [Desulfotomaculum sp.]